MYETEERMAKEAIIFFKKDLLILLVFSFLFLINLLEKIKQNKDTNPITDRKYK